MNGFIDITMKPAGALGRLQIPSLAPFDFSWLNPKKTSGNNGAFLFYALMPTLLRQLITPSLARRVLAGGLLTFGKAVVATSTEDMAQWWAVPVKFPE